MSAAATRHIPRDGLDFTLQFAPPAMHLPISDDRKRHVYIIARLLDKGATRVPPAIVAKKLLRLATKMEQQLFEMTHGRPLGEDSIRQHLVALAHAACKRTTAKKQVEIISV